jgi:hypothetical protein
MHTHEESLVRCRHALASHWLHDPGAPEVRRTVEELGAQAREADIAPERMLVELKRAIHSAVTAAGAPHSDLEHEHARLVSIAIEAYYAAGAR